MSDTYKDGIARPSSVNAIAVEKPVHPALNGPFALTDYFTVRLYS